VIVKADDIGVALAKRQGGSGASRAIGRALVLGMPGFLMFLGAVGTAAMIWVGGGIIVHGLEFYARIRSVTLSIPLSKQLPTHCRSPLEQRNG
jgi:predicted DNA repair protein MutK